MKTFVKVLLVSIWTITISCLPADVLAQNSYTGDKQTKFLKTENSIPNQYIVVFSDSNSLIESKEEITSLAQSVAQAHNGRVERVYSSALKGFSVALSESQALALSQDALVKYVVEDGMAYPSGVQYNAPWGLDRIDQRDRPLNTTYSYTATGAGVRAYVIDTGVLPSHAEFGGRATAGADFINDGQNGIDCNGHGTHVSGTIAGSTYGVAKQATVIGVRVFGCAGGSPYSTVIAGVDWVRQNRVLPAVANMSLSGGANQGLDDAVRSLINSGVSVAVAAGNNYGADANNYSPARVGEAITVGATNITDARASFSNIGSALDLFAPGEDIISAWHTSNTATNTISGTSMATPHVAGVAALYLQANPTAAPAVVSNALTGSATPGRVSNPGAGSPNLLLYSLLNRGGYGGDVHFISYGNGVYDWQGAGCYDVAQPANPASSRFRFQVDAVPFAPNPGTTVAQRAGFTFPNTNKPYSVIISRTAPHIQLRAPLGGGAADTNVSITGDPNQSATIRFNEIGGAASLLGTIVVRTHSNGVIEYSADTTDGTNLRAFIWPNVVVDATVQPGRNLTELRGMAGVLPLQQNLLSRGGQGFTIETLRTNVTALNQFATSWACQSGQSLFETSTPFTGQDLILTVDQNPAAEQACEAAGVPRFAAERFEACVFDVVTGGDELGQVMAAHAGTVFALQNQSLPQPAPDPCTTTPTTTTIDLLRQNPLGLNLASRAVICNVETTNNIDLVNTTLRTLFDNQPLR